MILIPGPNCDPDHRSYRWTHLVGFCASNVSS